MILLLLAPPDVDDRKEVALDDSEEKPKTSDDRWVTNASVSVVEPCASTLLGSSLRGRKERLVSHPMRPRSVRTKILQTVSLSWEREVVELVEVPP